MVRCCSTVVRGIELLVVSRLGDTETQSGWTFLLIRLIWLRWRLQNMSSSFHGELLKRVVIPSVIVNVELRL